MDFSKFVTGSGSKMPAWAAKLPGAPAIPAEVVQFVTDLTNGSVRMSYGAWFALMKKVGVLKAESEMKDSYPKLDALPAHLQWAVCRENGMYSRNAWFKFAKDPQVAPKLKAITGMPVLTAQAVEAAWDEWAASHQQAAPVQEIGDIKR